LCAGGETRTLTPRGTRSSKNILFYTFDSILIKNPMKHIESYISEHKNRFLNELLELLKLPSISADSAYKNDVLKTAF